jgi:hypothetical protein
VRAVGRMAALAMALRFLVLFLVVRAAWSLWQAWGAKRRVTREDDPDPRAPRRFDTRSRDVEDAKFEEVREP